MIMKRDKLLRIPALLACLPLVGCSANSGYYIVTVSDPEHIVAEMPHKLGEKPSKKFKPGDGVIFRVMIVYDVDTIVEINGWRLNTHLFEYGDESEDNKWTIAYSFVMPKMDCEINVYTHASKW